MSVLSKIKFLKFGIPFLILVIGAPFLLKEVTSIRYEFRRNKDLTPEELAKLGIIKKKAGEVTLENEYEKLKQIDLDNWTNIRGPRPWEDNTEFEKLKQKNIEEKQRKLQQEASV